MQQFFCFLYSCQIIAKFFQKLVLKGQEKNMGSDMKKSRREAGNEEGRGQEEEEEGRRR